MKVIISALLVQCKEIVSKADFGALALLHSLGVFKINKSLQY